MRNSAGGKQGVLWHYLCLERPAVTVPSGTTVCRRCYDLVFSHLLCWTQCTICPLPVILQALPWSLPIRISFGAIFLFGHKQLITKNQLYQSMASKCVQLENSLIPDTRVQIAITRLTDLWQTLTRFWTGKDRCSTIVILKWLQRPSNIRTDSELPLSIHS